MSTKIAASGWVVLLCLSGCSADAKDELERYGKLTSKATSYAARYSGFKAVIDARVAAAKKDFAAAKALGDEKKKAEKMKAVNDGLAALIDRFTSYERKRREINVLKHDRWIRMLKGSKRRPLMRKTDRKLDDAARTLSSAEVTTVAAAKSKLSEANRKLQSALSALRKAKRKSKRKRKKK